MDKISGSLRIKNGEIYRTGLICCKDTISKPAPDENQSDKKPCPAFKLHLLPPPTQQFSSPVLAVLCQGRTPRIV